MIYEKIIFKFLISLTECFYLYVLFSYLTLLISNAWYLIFNFKNHFDVVRILIKIKIFKSSDFRMNCVAQFSSFQS